MLTKRSLVAFALSACTASTGTASAPSTAAPTTPSPETPEAPATAGGVELLPGFDPGAPPASGVQIVLPIVRGVAPSSSVEYCTWTDQILTAPLALKGTKAVQSKGGHHAVLYYTTRREAAGTTRPCTEDDMTTLRFASGSGGEGGGEDVLPSNLVVRIPVGAQLVVNHHYLNAQPTPIDAQTAIDVDFADPSAPSVDSSALAIVDTAIKVPPGVSTTTVGCTMKDEMAAWLLLPHMHQWGDHVAVDHVHGGATDRLYEGAWDESQTFHPPEIKRDPSSPLVLHAGDELRIACTWNNTTGKTMSFGLEMCVLFGQTVDATSRGGLECNAGSWSPF